MASFALSLLLSPAHAGSYVLSCTGGIATHDGPTNPFSTPYTLTSSDTYSGGGGRISNPSCAKPITATLTWQPASGQTAQTDPPPPSGSVIVMETCSAGASASVPPGQTCSAQCDDGMGSTQSASGSPVYDSSTPPQVTKLSASVLAKDVRYTVQGGATITLNISPSASATASAPNGPGGWQTGANVYYTVDAYPVTLSLGGTTPDASGNLNILVGQGCKASMSARPATLSNFQWSASPIFDQFLIASNQSSGYATFLSAAALTQPNPTWHWYLDSGGGSFMVSCSATATANGTVIGTVFGQQQVKVWAPYYYMNHNAGPTGIYGSDVSTGAQSLVPPGMAFVGAVGTPALFANTLGTGSWLFVQIINTSHYQWYPWSPIPVKSGSLGVALDNEWPYIPGWPADSTANASTPHPAEDSPDLGLLNLVDQFTVNDIYQMYLMYLPPDNGYGSQYVPLHRLTWEWNANGTLAGTWPAGSSGQVTVDSDLRWETHPTWSQIYINSHK